MASATGGGSGLAPAEAEPTSQRSSSATGGAAPAASPPAPPKVVLHTGDSMVGFYAGLEKALGPHFEALGSKYVQDAVTSASLVSFDKSDHFEKMLERTNPDLVILTLGANDVFIPSPARLAKNVQSIVKKMEGRRCFWMGPPLWKKDTGVVDVIRQNCAPCVFYDSSQLKLDRLADGIHPNEKGAREWADAFWDFYEAQGRGSAITAK